MVAEVALAVMLVVGAGLMLRSFWNLMQVDSGFDRSRLVTFGLSLTGVRTALDVEKGMVLLRAATRRRLVEDADGRDEG